MGYGIQVIVKACGPIVKLLKMMLFWVKFIIFNCLEGDEHNVGGQASA